jgi:uncharacterized protein YdaU (DUF1376 family)
MRSSYPWYVSDWRNSETRLRLPLEARAIYRELLDYIYFNNAASLPTDHEQLRKIAECSAEEFDRSWLEISRLFYEDGGRLRNRKADSVVVKLDDYSAQRRAAGKASAKARNQRAFNERSTSVEDMFNERSNTRRTGSEPGSFNERSTSVQPLFVDNEGDEPQRAFNERSTSVQPLSTTTTTLLVTVDTKTQEQQQHATSGVVVAENEQQRCPVGSVAVAQALRRYGTVSAKSAEKFISACLNGTGQYTESEIVGVIHRVGATIGKSAQNPVAILISQVPGSIAGEVSKIRETEALLEADEQRVRNFQRDQARNVADRILRNPNSPSEEVEWAEKLLKELE